MSSAPKPKNLILEFLLAADGHVLSAQAAIRGCALFEIAESTARVALVRLAAAGMIEGAGRGAYRLGPAAAELAGDLATWRSADRRLVPWTGAYVAVHCGALGRSDRAALRTRDRALHLLGFAEAERGLHLRPDNLEGGVGGVRQRLHALGLERAATVFAAAGFEPAREASIRALWDGATLDAGYRRTAAALEAWLARVDGLDVEVAAREAFLLGGKAIRQWVFDPLLPEPLVDAGARTVFIDTLRRFDAAGRDIWRRLFAAPQNGGDNHEHRALSRDRHFHA